MADMFIDEEGLAGWVEALGPGEAAERSHLAHEQAQAWVDGIYLVIEAFVEGIEDISPVDEYSDYEKWAPLGVPDNPYDLGFCSHLQADMVQPTIVMVGANPSQAVCQVCTDDLTYTRELCQRCLAEEIQVVATDILGFTLTAEGVTPLVLVAEICDSCRVEMFGR